MLAGEDVSLDTYLKLLTWKGESGVWLCAHKHFDVLTQGSTREEATCSFLKVFAIEVMLRLQPDGTFDPPMRVTPEETRTRWEVLARGDSDAQPYTYESESSP